MKLRGHFGLLLALVSCSLGIFAQTKQDHAFDPFRAEKNLEIGEFYLKKGNYDAAIERFKESIRYKPKFARPHRLLAEAYEKKGDAAEAVKYYRMYLEILPAAQDAGKVRKRIEKLSRTLEREAKRSPSLKSR